MPLDRKEGWCFLKDELRGLWPVNGMSAPLEAHRSRQVAADSSAVSGGFLRAKQGLYEDEAAQASHRRRPRPLRKVARRSHKHGARSRDRNQLGSVRKEHQFSRSPGALPHSSQSQVSSESAWPIYDPSADFRRHISSQHEKSQSVGNVDCNGRKYRQRRKTKSEVRSDSWIPFTAAAKKSGESPGYPEHPSSRQAALAGISSSPGKRARSSGGCTSQFRGGEMQRGESCGISADRQQKVDPRRAHPEGCDKALRSGASAPDARAQGLAAWDSGRDLDAGYTALATRASVNRSENLDMRLAQPNEIFSVTQSGHVLERHVQNPWPDISDCGLLSSCHDTPSLVLDRSSVKRKKQERDRAATTPSSKCETRSTTDDTVLDFADSESTAPVPSTPRSKGNSLEAIRTSNSTNNVPVVEKRGNQAFGDCSENGVKTLPSLQKAAHHLLPLMGEFNVNLPQVSAYMCHEMRKGGLRKKKLRPLSSRCTAPPAVNQQKRPPSFDVVARDAKAAAQSKTALLECSSPVTGCNRDGKHLLKVLKASGLSAVRPAPPVKRSLSQSATASVQTVNVVDCDVPPAPLKLASSVTPLSEPPVVEQPFKRIVLLRKKAVIYPALLLLALALAFGITTYLLHERASPTMNPQLTTVRVPKSLLSGNTSLVSQDAPKEEYDTCSTAACKRDGAYLKGLLSWDLDPCDNFHRFVCGRWKADSVKAGAASDELSHQLEKSVHVLLQRSSSPDDLAPLKALFYECMNVRQLDIDDWNPMLELIWLVNLEGFPFSSTPRNSTSLWKIAAKVLKMTGAEALLSMRAVAHPTKNDAGVVSVGLPSMLAPMGSDQQLTTQFYNSTSFTCITALKKQRNPTVYSLEVAAFASRLEMLVNSYTVLAGLQAYPVVPLKTKPELSAFLVEAFLNIESPLYSASHTDVLIQSPSFFDALFALVRNTEQYVVMNYLGVRLMIEVAAFAPSAGRPLVLTLVHHRAGRSVPSLPRWKLCIRTVERALPDLFLHASKLAFKTQFAVDMVQHLLEALSKRVAQSMAKLAILDSESRARVHTLLNNTRFRLFRPAWLSSPEKLESYVSALPRVVRGQSLRSFYTLYSHSFAENLRRDHADRWHGSAFDTECTFDGNIVYVPVLLFNFTLFSYDADQSLQLPSSGVRITRCLLDMLLNSVASGSDLGPSASRVWWPDMSSSFLAVAQLCIQQYGVRQLGALELLQRTAALKPALDLFQDEKRLDVRFETFQAYSVFHLFFVYYALTFCEESVADNTTDTTLASFLTNVPLWNNRLFQETFRCPVGSNMNPSKKCVLWRDTH